MGEFLLSIKQIRREILLISTWFIGVMAIKFTLPILPSIVIDLQTTTTLVKYTISVFLFGKAFGMLFFGPLSEKYGRKIFMLIGLFVFTAGNILAFYSFNIVVLLFARLLQGLGTSASVLIGRAMINDTYKNNKAAIVFSHVFFATSIIICFLPMLGSLITMYFPWQYTFLMMGSYSLVIFIFCFFFLDETHERQPSLILNIKNILLYYKTIISHPLFLGYVLCSIFMIAGESAFNTASSFLLINTLHTSTTNFGILMTSLALGHLIGTLICGKLVKRYNLPIIMGVGVMILAISTTIMAFSINTGFATIPVIIIPMIIYYIGTGFVMTITAVGAVVPFPHLIAISTAASLLLNFTFSAASSAIMRHLSTNTAGPVSLVVAACGISALLSWYFLISPNERMHGVETITANN